MPTRLATVSVGVTVVLAAAAFGAWQHASSSQASVPPGVAFPSRQLAVRQCRSYATRSFGHVPAADTRRPLIAASIAHLKPVGGIDLSSTLVVLKYGPAGAGFYCLMNGVLGPGITGPAWPPTRGHPIEALPLYAAKSPRYGYVGYVVATTPRISSIVAVSSASETRFIRPVDGLSGFFLRTTYPGGPLGSIIAFDKAGQEVARAPLP